MVLKGERYSARLQIVLCRKELGLRGGAKSQVQHPDSLTPIGWRKGVFPGGKKRQRGVAFADEDGHAIPHAFKPGLEPQNINVPPRGTGDVSDRQSHVIDAFELNHFPGV